MKVRSITVKYADGQSAVQSYFTATSNCYVYYTLNAANYATIASIVTQSSNGYATLTTKAKQELFRDVSTKPVKIRVSGTGSGSNTNCYMYLAVGSSKLGSNFNATGNSGSYVAFDSGEMSISNILTQNSDIRIYMKKNSAWSFVSCDEITISFYYDEEETTETPFSISYNGSVIAAGTFVGELSMTYNGVTINIGESATASCANKIMSSNLVIGDKTLQCKDKLMATDVVITI